MNYYDPFHGPKQSYRKLLVDTYISDEKLAYAGRSGHRSRYVSGHG